MPTEMSFNRYVHAQEGVRNNDPPIRVNQRWVGYVDNEVFRRIRILAPHPDGGWIFKDEPAKMKHIDYSRMSICPEFNLRYVFELEKGES